MKKEDLRVKRTKRVLKDTFLNMLESTDINKISISELCNKASINRRTFYLHYSNVNEILDEIINDYSLEFFNRIKEFDFINDLDKIIAEYFIFSEEKDGLYKKLNINPDLKIIKDKMIDTSINMNSGLDNYNDYIKNILFSYFNDSLIGIYKQWVNDGKVLSIFRIIELSINLINNGINNILKQD